METLLKNLVSLPNETETVEFKENNFNKKDIGERIYTDLGIRACSSFMDFFTIMLKKAVF